MTRWLSVLLISCISTVPVFGSDLSKIDRSIKKEPTYTGKPKYALVVFGPEAANKVWLVQDGDSLYVDRNGNGDLTEADKKVAAKVDKNLDVALYGYLFEVGELKVGGKVHKHLSVSFPKLNQFVGLNDNPFVREALKADPDSVTAIIQASIESSRLKGRGVGERLIQMVGPMDPTGILQFADKPDKAPIIHFDGPMHISLYGEIPTLRLDRDNDLVLDIGTPGVGSGTFAMIQYAETIPEGVFPKAEFVIPGGDPGKKPVKELFELKERC
jgi:hypothetical protein